MNIIDTHVHLQDFTSENVKYIIISSNQAGIEKFVCVSSTPEDWEKVEKLYKSYPNQIIPAFGLHPWYAKENSKNLKTVLEDYIKKYPNSLIGEIGLDGYREPDKQIEVFEEQLFFAHKYNRPVIIHSLKAQNWFEQNWHLLPSKYVFHSYNGKKEFLKEIINHNGYVSFSLSILKNKDKEELINMVPDNKILIETDSPYQSEEKGKDNEPLCILKLLENIAQIRGESKSVFAEKLYQNSMEFIKI